MIVLVVALVVVCAAFSGTYISTGDIWTALFAGGIPALLYMTGLAVQATCKTSSRGCRVAVGMVAVVILTGVSAQFMIVSSLTRGQTAVIAVWSETFDRSAVMSSLFEHASPVFVSFQQQGGRKRHSVAEIFKDSWKGRDWASPLVYLDSPSERLKIYASTNADGSVMLTGVAAVTKGADPNFANANGTSGYLQSRLCVSPQGMTYEIEN